MSLIAVLAYISIPTLTGSSYFGSSRFSVGLSSDIRDGDELNQREEIVFIPVSISNSLCILDPVVETFQLAS